MIDAPFLRHRGRVAPGHEQPEASMIRLPWMLRGLFFVCVATAVTGLTATAQAPEANERLDPPTRLGDPVDSTLSPPNIIIIQVDDHGYGDLSHTEIDTGVSTPNLDRLAAEGIRFTQGYATSPICTPSRIGLLLGRYQQRFDNWWYGGPGLPENVPTIAEVLRGAGYVTGMVGKYHVNRPFKPGLRNFPLDHGFDYFFGFNAPAVHYLRRGPDIEEAFLDALNAHEPEQAGYPLMFYEPLWENTDRVSPEGFSTEIFTDRAIQFIDAADQRPFFLLLSYNAIHDQTYQLPEAFFDRIGVKPPRDWDPARESSEEWREAVFADGIERTYILGQIAYLDQSIGTLLDHLETKGQRKQTVVIYVSDNGGSIYNLSRNDPLRGGKFSMCEGGIRIPFLVSWPGVFPQGVTLDHVVSTLDLMPTTATLAQTTIPDGVDGQNLVPLLTGGNPENEHRTLVWDSGPMTSMFAVRDGDWKLYFAPQVGRISPEIEGIGYRLTNLTDDPGESKNLLAEHPEIAARLQAIHRRWLDAIYGQADP